MSQQNENKQPVSSKINVICPDCGAEFLVHGKSVTVPRDNRDEYGRDTTGWIEVNGKLRPHP